MRTLKVYVEKDKGCATFKLKPFIDLCIPLFHMEKIHTYVNPSKLTYSILIAGHKSYIIKYRYKIVSFVIFISIFNSLFSIEVFVDLL